MITLIIRDAGGRLVAAKLYLTLPKDLAICLANSQHPGCTIEVATKLDEATP